MAIGPVGRKLAHKSVLLKPFLSIRLEDCTTIYRILAETSIPIKKGLKAKGINGPITPAAVRNFTQFGDMFTPSGDQKIGTPAKLRMMLDLFQLKDNAKVKDFVLEVLEDSTTTPSGCFFKD